jgi:two-component system LytT family response regulator
MTEGSKIRSLIVDDELLPRRYIRQMLACHPEVEIIGDCANGYEAIAAIGEHAPDLVFLDVQMPEIDGFDVLEKLAPATLPLVIFVSAYDEYALQAFEVSAVDYLFKPFNQERFDKALQKAKNTLANEKGGEWTQRALALLEEMRASSSFLDRLLVKKQGGRAFFLTTDELDWIEAEGKHVRLHVGPQSHLLRESISALEAQLHPKKFPRINRSTIVNLARVRELQPMFHHEYLIVLYDGTELKLTNDYRKKLADLLGLSL